MILYSLAQYLLRENQLVRNVRKKGAKFNLSFWFTYHWLECDLAVLPEGGLALLLGGGLVVGDVGHVAFLVVAVGALQGAVVHNLLNLVGKKKCHKNKYRLCLN